MKKWLTLLALSAGLFSVSVKADTWYNRFRDVRDVPNATPKVDNNTALSALASTYATSVVRLGFAAAGDAPAVTYTPSNSACSLNAGAGDGGSQVPTSDGKCWIAGSFWSRLTSFPGAGSNLNGLNVGAQGHPTWGVVQPTANYSGSQWQVYGTAAQGRATPSAGTGNITLNSGSDFDLAWIGLPFFYFHADGDEFGGRYKVSAVADASHLTVQTISGGAVSLAATQGTFHFVADISQTVVNCAASVCTRVSGDLFSPFSSVSQPSYVVISGTVYQANSSTSTTVTLTSSPGTLTGVSATQYTWDYDNISLFRVQKLLGASEEAMLIGARAVGNFEIRSTFAGTGKYRPIVIGSGELSPGNLADQIVVHPDGNLSLAGAYGADSVRVQGNDLTTATNFLYIPTKYAGQDVTLAAGQNTGDTNVGVNLTTLGSGTVKANGSQVLTASMTGTSGTKIPYLDGTNTWSSPNTFNSVVSLVTQSYMKGDFSDFRFTPASGSNTNRWRIGTTINGASDGYWYLQHSTDAYVANFWTPLACTTTGCGFGGNESPSYSVDVTGQVNASTGFSSGGTAGLSVTKTVRASGGAADCTLIYTGGILTGGTC